MVALGALAAPAAASTKVNYGDISHKGLKDLGHQVQAVSAYDSAVTGRGQAILFNSASKTKFGASDPRADGSAVPEPIR